MVVAMSCGWQRAVCVTILISLSPWQSERSLYTLGLSCNAQKDLCGCVFDDGSGTVDVGSLGNTDGTPRFQTEESRKNQTYYYNPCVPFNKGSCSGAAVCAVSDHGGNSSQLGDAEPVGWLYDGQGPSPNTSTVIASYQHNDGQALSQSFVKFVCDPAATEPTFNLENADINTYYFTLTSECACPDAGCFTRTYGTKGQMSTGSAMLIVFFVFVCVYLVGGVIFNRTQRNATGLELVPNITFWRAVPGYIKDGMLFSTCNLCGRWKGTYQEVN